jgi:DUF438 domain-containing protein
MEFNRHISRRLHEEHEVTLALWSRVEASLAANRPDAALLRSAAAALAEELDRHFAFEESELFPRLAAAGESDIGSLLADEHATIREVGREFIALVKAEPGNARLRPLGLELAERLVAHVQKEEMSLLPSLDDLLDDDADRELSSTYALA